MATLPKWPEPWWCPGGPGGAFVAPLRPRIALPNLDRFYHLTFSNLSRPGLHLVERKREAAPYNLTGGGGRISHAWGGSDQPGAALSTHVARIDGLPPQKPCADVVRVISLPSRGVARTAVEALVFLPSSASPAPSPRGACGPGRRRSCTGSPDRGRAATPRCPWRSSTRCRSPRAGPRRPSCARRRSSREVARNCLPQARHFHLRRVGMTVGLGAAAGRAEGFPAVLRKADRGERLERLIVGHAVHVPELEGPGGGGEEEVLGHLSYQVGS